MTSVNIDIVNGSVKPKKKVSEKKIKIIKIIKFIIDNGEEFVNQLTRKDVLYNLLNGINKSGIELFQCIMTDNNPSITIDEKRQGFLYETIWELLIALKCIKKIDYTELCDGQLQSLSKITKLNTILRKKIVNGNNVSDVTIKQGSTTIPISIKYKKKFNPTSTNISDLESTIKLKTDDFKVGFIVKDKNIVIKHKYTNKENIHKQVHDRVIEYDLLFDEMDLINGLEVFKERFASSSVINIEEFIEMIDCDYFLNPRKQLVKWLHQKMNLEKIIQQILKGEQKILISQMPRSGKSILMLSTSKYLLENGRKRILIMTSIPATIDSFTNDLDNYLDFKHIRYIKQDEFSVIDNDFIGIVFSSTQFLKIDSSIKNTSSLVTKKTKKEILKNIGFDAVFDDECHLGGSTAKTEKDILDVVEDVKIDNDVEDVYKFIPLTIFASGTSDKTVKFYKIKSPCINSWEMTDVAYMKQLSRLEVNQTEKDEIIEIMKSNHGPEFTKCLYDLTSNKDYSTFPTQVLMKYSIPESLIYEIKEYNIKYGTNFGFSCATLFALYKDEGDSDYQERFQLAQRSEGKSILIEYLNCIISSQGMKETIMKQIECLQFKRKSRQSTIENPLLFITYLPTHTRNNTIQLLQRTLIKFLEENNLWTEYNIEASNATEDTGYSTETYNKFTQDCIKRTQEKGKKGCILLLGSQGTTGITYPECDVTISLDDGHNLDNQKQRLARSMTDAVGKTIGINVDMNIQRTYLYLIDIIQKHRKLTKTKKTNAEILYYLYKHNVFLFNPQEFNNGSMKITDIQSFYEIEAGNLMREIDDSTLLDGIICDDDMRSFILGKWEQKLMVNKKINSDLEGLQQDCPKGDKTATEIDGVNMDGKEDEDDQEDEDDEEDNKEKMEVLVNQTLEICKAFLMPLLALISRSYKIFNFKEIFTNEITGPLIISLISKKIELNKDNYIIIISIMNNIIDNNEEIINNIREIYQIASPEKLRSLIAKHFVPSNTEKKQNAEVPTPVSLVNDMLDKIPLEFWMSPRKVFEPCCGKGNFILGIFDRFDKGLKPLISDNEERCRVIMTECIYYADLTPLNVFITTEIMKCHVQSCCGLEELDYSFNFYTGDTLKLNVGEKWSIEGFDAVIGNPPYNSSGDTATGNTIWQDFTKQALNNWIISNGYLLFVHPPGWRKPNTERGKFTKMFDLMTKQNQMLYLEIHGIKDGQKVFNCGTRYDWYLIKKTNQYKNTIIVDENGKQNEINLSELSWLPNSNILEINKILAKNDCERCPIIQSMSAYEPRKKWMSSIQSQEFKYPCVHSTPKAGIRYMYSKVNDRGHFGVSKVIFGDSGIYKPVIDMEGKYGMTQHSMAIQVDNLEEATYINKVIESDKFDKIIQSCLYSSYAIDWNIFKEFKKDFWKEFI